MSEPTAFHVLIGKHHRLEQRVHDLENALRLLIEYNARAHGDPAQSEYEHVVEVLNKHSQP